jgi:hypothetical protein
MDGLIPFLHAASMPPIRRTVRTSQNITTSMPPIRQNGWTYNKLARDRHATQTPILSDQSYHNYLHATHTQQKWMVFCYS